MPTTNILITGAPGVGKTTLIRNLCSQLQHLSPVGFYTSEIREAGVRQGFELVSLDGRRSLLSHIDINSRHRVGRYGVDLAGFDAFLRQIDFAAPNHELIVIDEIGKMECLSDGFSELLRKILDADRTVLATIALKGGGLISEVKRRPDVKLFHLITINRNRLGAEILDSLK